MDGLECKEVCKSELERTLRIDSEFYSKNYVEIYNMLSSLAHKPLTAYVDVSDGNHMGISEQFSDEGIPYYRGQDAGAFFIENSNPICIDEITFNRPVMKRSHLTKGDVLLSIVGTIGALSLVYSNKKATCSCKLAILRPKKNGIEAVIATFLKGKYGQAQIKRYTRGAVQKGLILEDMDQLLIPEFSDDFTKSIHESVQYSHTLQERAIAEYESAEHILRSKVDVGVVVQTSISQKALSASFGSTGRLDAEYYQEKYQIYESAVRSSVHGYTCVRNAFLPVKEKCLRDLPFYHYVEIGDVNVETGIATFNVIDTEQLPDNAKIMTQKGDLLVSTVRPNRGAVAILESDDLLVSGAFTVLREAGDYPKEVLQVLLRTSMYRDWLLRFNVGTSYPVIKDEDVLNMPIPLLEDNVKQDVVNKVNESASLRRQSKQLLEYAKQAVEMAIEQGEDAALVWLKERSGE